MKVTEGTVKGIEFSSIEVKVIIGGKTIRLSEEEYARLTLDSGEGFTLSGKSGRELEELGVRQTKVKITQDDGTISIEQT